MNLPATATRVEEQTDPRIKEEIRQRTEAWFNRYAEAPPEQINRRLRELDREWDIERALQTNFSIINLASITWGALVNRACYLLPGVTGIFMLQHALKGWCPPVPILRRLGFRTAAEIAHERYALKAIRGDFDEVDPARPESALWAAERDGRE